MKRIIESEKQNIIGARIKEARVKAVLSQKELSEKIGIDGGLYMPWLYFKN